jgi:hypothetical protein
MSLIEEEKKDEQESAQQKLFIIVGVASIVLLGILGFWWIRSGGGQSSSASMINPNQKLEGADVIREGTPEFDKYKEKILMDAPEAAEAERVIGDIVMTLEAKVRNFSGRTLVGLEVYGAVVDLKGKPVKERTVTVIPNQQEELDNNKVLPARVYFEGFKISDDRANIKMRITAFRFAP